MIDRNKTYIFRKKIRLVYTSSFWEGRHMETDENVMTVDTSVMEMLYLELEEDLSTGRLELVLWSDGTASINADWIVTQPFRHHMKGNGLTSAFPSVVGTYKLTKISDKVPE